MLLVNCQISATSPASSFSGRERVYLQYLVLLPEFYLVLLHPQQQFPSWWLPQKARQRIPTHTLNI